MSLLFLRSSPQFRLLSTLSLAGRERVTFAGGVGCSYGWRVFCRSYGWTEEKLAKQFTEAGAGDCFSWFSFPGRHGLPGVARRLSFAWSDRWLGRTLY